MLDSEFSRWNTHNNNMMLHTKATYHSANHCIENKNIESFAFSFLLSLKKQCNWKPIQVHCFEALGAHSSSHLHSKAYRISQWKREEQASEQAHAQQPTTRCKWALCYIAFVFHMLVSCICIGRWWWWTLWTKVRP